MTAVKRRAHDAATVLETNRIAHTIAVALRCGLLEEEPLMPSQEQIEQAATIVVQTQFGSLALVQRKLQVTFAESRAILDQLAAHGIVSQDDGGPAREVFFKPDRLDEVLDKVRQVNA